MVRTKECPNGVIEIEAPGLTKVLAFPKEASFGFSCFVSDGRQNYTPEQARLRAEQLIQAAKAAERLTTTKQVATLDLERQNNSGK